MWDRHDHGDAEEAPAPEAASTPRGLRTRLQNLSWRVRLPLLAVLYGITLGALFLSGAFVYYTIQFPDPSALRQRERTPTIKILARDGSVLATRGSAHAFVPYKDLPNHLVDAVVATEDRRFFKHYGLDPLGLIRASFANLRSGRYSQGGSTLTQQLAKNLFLSPERTLERKLEELVLALWLEVRLTKQDILALYLNRVYFGGGAYGIEAAAQRHFGKTARELTLAESAIVAGLLKAPSRFSPAASTAQAQARARVVLDGMVRSGRLAERDAAQVKLDAVRFADADGKVRETGLEYAVDYALEQLPPVLGNGHYEIIVETTIDADLQRHAHRTVVRALAGEGAAAGATQASLTVLDTDGGIRALIGGRSWAQSQFNRAVKARRQPGSAFKPLVYLAAVELGATADTIAHDRPITIDGWSPRNDQGHHRGAMTLRHALAHSVNSVAVALQQEIGGRRIIDLARRLGIRSDLRDDPSLALGTSEVTLLELAQAYGALATGGHTVDAYIVRTVRTGKGHVLYSRPVQRSALAVSPAHAGIMSDLLNAAIVSGTGRRAALPSHPAAGKTGTTQDYRDAWFLGYTAHFAGGVWIGNDGAQPMSRVAGGGLPARIWREVMIKAHGRLPPRPLVRRPSSSPQQPAAATARTQPLPNILPVATPQSPLAPRRTQSEPRGYPAATQAPPALPRMPRQAIDEKLFLQALGRQAPPTSPQGHELDTAGLETMLRHAPEGRMSLGAR